MFRKCKKILFSRYFVFGTLVLIAASSLLYAATISDNTQSEFDAGTYSDTQWDGGNSWVELDATGLTNGSGNFISDIHDATADSSWDTFAWAPNQPFYKELPDSAATETAYANGNADMTDNVLLMHMDESSGTITDSSGQGNNGIYNGVLYSQTGKINTTMGFDGDDYIDLGSDLSLDIANGTVATWLKIESYSADNRAVVSKDASVLILLSSDVIC